MYVCKLIVMLLAHSALSVVNQSML